MKEFLEGMTPLDKNYRDLVVNRNSYNQGASFSRENAFTPSTLRLMIGFLKALVQSEEDLERVRDNLRLRRNFDVSQAFSALDKTNKGYVTVEDISEHLTSRYLFSTNSEISYLLPRFDKIKCGHISLKEFIREMRPKLVSRGK